jgi:hypothetical protein
MSQESYTYTILSPTKKLSQLIAQSWLNGEALTIDKQILVDNHILSEKEAELFNIQIQESGCGYINAATFEMCFVYSQERPPVTDQELQEWIDSPENSPPWVPLNPTLQSALRLWETIYSR